MMRAYFLGCFTVALLALGVALGLGLRTGGADAHAANRVEPPPVRMGFVSLSELMTKSADWQRGAKGMADKRDALGKRIAEKGASTAKLKAKYDAENDPLEKNRLAGELVEATREHEDAQRKGIAKLDEESLVILQDLHASFEKALKEEVKERALDVVFGCPINPTQLFKNGQKSMNELNLYFRPPAANPLHMAPEYDITDAIAARMNAVAN